MKKLTLLLITTAFILTSCGIYKRSDVKDNPVNVKERVKKNIEEGRGIRFGKGSSQGGVFDFASSNELWRASIEILDFVPFSNVSYSGGIIITDWFSGNSKVESENRDYLCKGKCKHRSNRKWWLWLSRNTRHQHSGSRHGRGKIISRKGTSSMPLF